MSSVLRIELWHVTLLGILLLGLMPFRIIEPWAFLFGGGFMALNFFLLGFGVRWVLTPAACILNNTAERLSICCQDVPTPPPPSSSARPGGLSFHGALAVRLRFSLRARRLFLRPDQVAGTISQFTPKK